MEEACTDVVGRREAREMISTIIGIEAIALGSLYIVKPTILRRGIWLKKSLIMRSLSAEAYDKGMRLLGVVAVVSGVTLILLGQGVILG